MIERSMRDSRIQMGFADCNKIPTVVSITLRNLFISGGDSGFYRATVFHLSSVVDEVKSIRVCPFAELMLDPIALTYYFGS